MLQHHVLYWILFLLDTIFCFIFPRQVVQEIHWQVAILLEYRLSCKDIGSDVSMIGELALEEGSVGCKKHPYVPLQSEFASNSSDGWQDSSSVGETKGLTHKSLASPQINMSLVVQALCHPVPLPSSL